MILNHALPQRNKFFLPYQLFKLLKSFLKLSTRKKNSFNFLIAIRMYKIWIFSITNMVVPKFIYLFFVCLFFCIVQGEIAFFLVKTIIAMHFLRIILLQTLKISSFANVLTFVYDDLKNFNFP